MKTFIFFIFLLLFVQCSSNHNFYIEDDEAFQQASVIDTAEEQPVCQSGEICSITEKFTLNGSDISLSLLFVVDVSQSMREHLKRLGSALKPFLSHIKNFDWKMAFTTADHGDHVKTNGRVGGQSWQNYNGSKPHFGRFMNLEFRGSLMKQKILNKQNDLYETIFYDTLTVNEGAKACRLAPYCQGDHEQPLKALKAAIEREENKKFFGRKKKSDFAAVIITNEDERVEDIRNAVTAEEVKNTFYSVFPKGKSFYGFGIIVKSEDCYEREKSKDQAVEYGKRVGRLASLTNGKNISICAQDYGSALRDISSLIKKRVLDNVYLSTARPDPDSVEVKMDPAQSAEWKVEGRHIVFTPSLKEGTKVEVTYTPL